MVNSNDILVNEITIDKIHYHQLIDNHRKHPDNHDPISNPILSNLL